MARGKGEGGITRRKDGSYMGRIELPAREADVHGKPVRRRKYVYAKTKADLLKKMRAVRRQLESHGDLETASMTVAQWMSYWMQEVATKDRRPKTVASYRSIVARVVEAIGTVRLDQLTALSIRGVYAHMSAEGLSSTYQRNAHGVMSAAFRDAERAGRLNRNPVDLVDPPRKSVTSLEALTVDEAVALIRTFADTPDGALWATYLLTGARRSEILGLEWDRVGEELDLSWQLQRLPDGPRPADFEYRRITGGLYWTRPKTRAGWRVIPLVDPLRSVLAQWRAQAPSNPWGLVFTRPSGAEQIPLDPDYVSKLWPAVRRAAGITRNVRLHDVRHSTVDLLYAAGVPEDLIPHIVGHSTRAMSRAYQSKQNRERLRGAMLQLSTLVGDRSVAPD